MGQEVFNSSFSPDRKWKIGANVVLSVLALLVLLILANYIAARHSMQFRWAADGRTQLSPVTREVLRSVTNEVRVIVFFDRTKPLYDLVADLLAQYQALSPRLQLEYVDYERSPGRGKAVQTEYNLAPASEGDRIVFDSAGKRSVVYAKDLSEFDYNALLKGQEVRRTGFKGELLFTSAIYSLIDTRPVRVYFLQGHKEHDPEDKDERAGYLRFAQVLQESQVTVSKLDASALLAADVPADCQMLVVANPQTRLAPQELERLDKYLNAGGRLLVLFSVNSLKEPTGLERLLANWGVDVGRNFVHDAPQGRPGDEPELIVTRFANHPIVSSLAGSRLVLILPRSVAARAKNPQSADAPKVAELATTSPEGLASQPNGKVDRQDATIPLMVAVEKGAIQGITADRGAARIVAVGDSFFLVNKLIQLEGNRDFARNAANWLLSRDVLVQGIGSRSIREYRVNLTAKELARVRWLFLGGFPGSVLTVGLLVWLRRRA